jgi:serine/threonine-protein kinase RsbW
VGRPIEIHAEPPVLDGEIVLQVEIESDLDHKESTLDQVLEILLGGALIAPEQEFPIRLCLDEALVNAIKHGNKLERDKIVTVTVYHEGESWAVTIEDEGEGFDADDVPDPDDPASLELPGGRGIHLKREIMDTVHYWENGSKLYVSKKIPEESADDTDTDFESHDDESGDEQSESTDGGDE